MSSSGKLGHKDTMKQRSIPQPLPQLVLNFVVDICFFLPTRLTRAFRKNKMGLTLSADEHALLFQTTTQNMDKAPPVTVTSTATSSEQGSTRKGTHDKPVVAASHSTPQVPEEVKNGSKGLRNEAINAVDQSVKEENDPEEWWNELTDDTAVNFFQIGKVQEDITSTKVATKGREEIHHLKKRTKSEMEPAPSLVQEPTPVKRFKVSLTKRASVSKKAMLQDTSSIEVATSSTEREPANSKPKFKITFTKRALKNQEKNGESSSTFQAKDESETEAQIGLGYVQPLVLIYCCPS
jgi:hypothetical protein